MKLSQGEKLITYMLCEIYEKLGMGDKTGHLDPKFMRGAVAEGHLWAIDWKYPGLQLEHETPPEIVKRVGNYLNMWSYIEDSYDRLSDTDKKKIVDSKLVFGPDVKFRGFDGNNESEYLSTAHFLIEDVGRYERYSKMRDMNSHAPSVEGYERMYRVFEPLVYGGHGRDTLLSADEIIHIVRERIHPKNRDW